MKCYAAYTPCEGYVSYPPYISINEGPGDVVHVDVRSAESASSARLTMARERLIAFLRETLEQLER